MSSAHSLKTTKTKQKWN